MLYAWPCTGSPAGHPLAVRGALGFDRGLLRVSPTQPPARCYIGGMTAAPANTAPARHTYDGRPLADVDYINCMNGHESCYERGTIPLLNRRPPVDTDDGGPWWLCPHADGPDNDCDDKLCLTAA